MDRPGVSVIIPAFNEERYISAAIQSVLSEKYSGNLKIIIVNNASTDQTKAVVGELIRRT